MSLHPSLKISTAGAAQRTVLSRIERIKELMKKGVWTDSSSVLALPKTKMLKLKTKKEKSAKKDDAAAPAAAGKAAPAAGAAAAKKPEAKKK
ncbi:MAG: small basic protein [Candidatus Omnitrophica bacterium]|nr:small basic protein [Candidatus Omnitrophota bacterium]